MNTCKTCKHWRQMGERGSGRVPDDAVRHCIANSPIRDFVWPRTEATHTCGQWAPVDVELKLENQSGGEMSPGAIIAMKSPRRGRANPTS